MKGRLRGCARARLVTAGTPVTRICPLEGSGTLRVRCTHSAAQYYEIRDYTVQHLHLPFLGTSALLVHPPRARACADPRQGHKNRDALIFGYNGNTDAKTRKACRCHRSGWTGQCSDHAPRPRGHAHWSADCDPGSRSLCPP